MPHRPTKFRTQVLSEPVAAHLLARASELDASRVAGAEVAELGRRPCAASPAPVVTR